MDCNNNETDDWLDDWFEIDILVFYSNRPSNGFLKLTSPYLYPDGPAGEILIPVANTNNHNSSTNNGYHYFNAVKLKAQIQQYPIDITAEFTDPVDGCMLNNPDAGPIWDPAFDRVKTREQCSVCPCRGGCSQTYPNCWPEENLSQIDPCNDFTNYGPDPDFPELTPIRYIKVVLHIFQKEDPNNPGMVDPVDPGNYNAIDHMGIIQSWFTDPNGTNKQWSVLCADPTISSPTMTDARLRVVNTGTEGYDVFFHPDDNAWGGSSFPVGKYITNPNPSNPYYAALIDPEIKNAHHIFINGSGCPGGFTQSGQFCNGNDAWDWPASVITGNYNSYLSQGDPLHPCGSSYPGNDTALGQNILGEIYHLLGVDHLSPLQAHFMHNDLPGSSDGCYDTPLGMENQNLTGCIYENRCALSQCQIGRMHRFLEKNQPAFERFLVGHEQDGTPIFSMTEKNCNLVDPDMVIPDGADVLWAGPRSIRSNIIVESGGKLTITCDIGMPNDARITVESGGRLVIDGARIYNNCDGGFWQGIEVYGTDLGQLPPVPNGQGYVSLLAGSVIERARFPVYVKKGGVVRAQSTDFLNCGTAGFYNYPSFSISHFIDCDFVRDAGFADLGSWPDQIFYQSYKNVRVSGCRFNTINLASNGSNGTAIRGFGSSFHVSGSTFEGYRVGVWGHSWFDDHVGTFTVRNCTFTENRIGIASWANDNVVITGNTFEGIGKHIQTGSHRGLTLSNCTGYTVKDNEFYGLGGTIKDRVGIWALNTGSEVNTIKRNKFEGVYQANLAEENNRGNDPEEGLQYLCNENFGNTYDFRVLDGGVAQYQGGSQDAAKNFFGHYNVTDGDFDNESGKKITYYYLPIAGQIPEYYHSISPVQVLNDVVDNCADLKHNDDHGILTPTEEPLIEQIFTSAKSSYDQLKASYTALLNGGDNEAVLTGTIQSATGQDAPSLKQDLLGISPYLTSGVLEAVVSRGDIFTNGDLYDILSANPDELGSPGFQDFLYRELDGLLADSILQNQGQATARTTTEGNLTRYTMDMHQAANRILISVLADTNSLDLSKYRLWLGNKGSIEARYALASSYMMEEDFVNTRLVRDSIPAQFGLSGDWLSEHGHYVSLTEIVINAIENDVHFAAYAPARVLQVQAIADNSMGVAGMMAKSLLNVYYGYEYELTPKPDTLQTAQLIKPPIGKTNELARDYQHLQVMPNPAKDMVSFQYKLGEELVDNEIQVFDVSGQLVTRFEIKGQTGRVQWHTGLVKRGVYFCKLEKGGVAGLPLKLVLIK